MKLQTVITILLVVFAVIASAFVYDKLPNLVPSHWNALGEIDGYLKKNTHIFMFLGLSIGLPLLLTYAPKLDPKYASIQKFEDDYQWFVVVFTGFIVALYLYVTAIALGYKLPMQTFMIPAMSILFFCIGTLLQKAKSNYTIGFRLPWTLHSEENWNATHQLASKAFKYGAFGMLFTLLLGSNAFLGLTAVIFCIAIIPVIYSYRLHTKGI